MNKGVTPIIAIVLLVFMTVSASMLAFFWMTTMQTTIQEGAGSSLEDSPVRDCSRLNIISTRSDGIVVQNVGCDSISSINLLIDGVLTDYNLDTPIAPGQASIITYDSLESGESHLLSLVLDNSQTSSSSILASQSTEVAGFCSNVCGDGVCCMSHGENWETCIGDCIIKTYLVSSASALYKYNYFDAGAKKALGNQTLFYSIDTDNAQTHNFRMVNDKIAFYGFSQEYPSAIYYSIYYDEIWGSVTRLTPDDGLFYYLVTVSNPDIREVIHLVYERCTSDMSGCDLFLRTWSRNNGFSEVIQLTNENYENWVQVDSVKMAVSNNAEYKIIMWPTVSSTEINYITYDDGSWSSIKTVAAPNFNGYTLSYIAALSANNDGEYAASCYASGSNPYQMLYYNGTWNNVNVTVEGYPFITTSFEDDFLISVSDSFDLAPNNYYVMTFDNGVFGASTQQNIRSNILSVLWGGIFGIKNKYDETIFGFVSATEGVYTEFLNGTTWDYMMDIPLCGNFGCEEYEKCSSECGTETWCSDTVDNDEDGLVDSADSDCP